MGLTRTAGGWFEVRSQRTCGGRELSDERILGSAGFVRRILTEADARTTLLFSPYLLIF